MTIRFRHLFPATTFALALLKGLGLITMPWWMVLTPLALYLIPMGLVLVIGMVVLAIIGAVAISDSSQKDTPQ